MRQSRVVRWLAFLATVVAPVAGRAEDRGTKESSYLPVAIKETTGAVQARMEAEYARYLAARDARVAEAK